MKVIAFSLWGRDRKYTTGALRNLELAQEFYPDWTPRFYCGGSVPSKTLLDFAGGGVEVIPMPEDGNWTGMFWRFAPASEDNVEAMISRDTDSRLSQREADAVQEWMDSDKGFHIMRDHPWHASQIMGGMWGAKRGAIPEMADLMAKHDQQNYWQIDQEFLNSVIYPRVVNNAMIHDSFKLIHGESCRPFPSPRQGLEFVGKVFDEHENTVEEHQEILRRCIGRGW